MFRLRMIVSVFGHELRPAYVVPSTPVMEAKGRG